MIFKHLMLVLMMVVFAFGGVVSAQNTSYPTDTVRHSLFGCDSLQLSANGTVYYHDTVVSIPHYAPVQGQIVMDVLNIYEIAIGKSYDVRDTVSVLVCKNNLPYAFRNNFFTQSGDYWINTPSARGCDSARTLLKLQVVEGQKTTVTLPMCADQPSVSYDGITFTEAGSYDFPQGFDANGCPMVKTYKVIRYTVASDTVYAEVCQNDLPYVFRGQSYNAAGSYLVEYINSYGCNAKTLLVLRVNPASAQTDTVNATVCRTELPYVYQGQEYNTAGSYPLTYYNQYGCDSLTRVLQLHITEPQMDTVTVTLCPDSFPYTYDSVHVFSVPGRYFIDHAPDTACRHGQRVHDGQFLHVR